MSIQALEFGLRSRRPPPLQLHPRQDSVDTSDPDGRIFRHCMQSANASPAWGAGDNPAADVGKRRAETNLMPTSQE